MNAPSPLAGEGLNGISPKCCWVRGTPHILSLRRTPCICTQPNLCDGSDLRFGRWPPAKARGDVARYPSGINRG